MCHPCLSLALWWDPWRIGGFNLTVSDTSKGKHLGQILKMLNSEVFLLLKVAPLSFHVFLNTFSKTWFCQR